MISFAAPAASMFAMENYLQQAAAAGLADRIRLLAYEDIFAHHELPVGSCVLSGIDRLTPVGCTIIARCRDELVRATRDVVVLNDPRCSLGRHDLLRLAFETGGNQFRAVRAPGLLRGLRFPVFVRSEREHTGSLTSLIDSPVGLGRELLLLCLRGYRLQDLLIVEYCNTSDADGVFRKYSAFIVGGQIIPRCLELSHHWVTKSEHRIIDEQTAEEEFHYVTHNPHEDWLRETFRLARGEYGRIDYALLAGKPQVWEINVAPTIGGRPGGGPPSARTDAQRLMLAPTRDHFYREFRAALERLDRPVAPSRTVTIAISPAEAAQLRHELQTIRRVQDRQTILSQLSRPPIQLVKR